MAQIGQGDLSYGLYYLKIGSPHFETVVHYSREFYTCHNRFDHTSLNKTKFILNSLGLSFKFSNSHCSICHIFKQYKLPFLNVGTWTKAIFDLIHLDVWGRYHLPTHNNKHFFLTLVNDFSKTTWLYLLTHKFEVSSIFINFYNMVQTKLAKE